MNPNENPTTDQMLREMRDLITARLYSALSDPSRVTRASLIGAATAWMRLTGAVEDIPRPGAAPGTGSVATRRSTADIMERLPYLLPGERERYRAEREARERADAEEREKLASQVKSFLATEDDDESSPDGF